MKKRYTLHKLALVLLLIVLLPALFYSGYEISSLSLNEKLMAEIYNRQLDVILYSINQYAWDVSNNWASKINMSLSENRNREADLRREALIQFLQKNRSILSIVLSDSAAGNVQFISDPQRNSGQPVEESTFIQAIKDSSKIIKRLLEYRLADYRKIAPIQIASGAADRHLGLTFVTDDFGDPASLATIIIDERIFIRDILSPKLREAAGDEFVLAIFRSDSLQPLFATSPVTAADLKQQKDLWLFPKTYLGIRPKGETIEDIVQSRFYRNLTLIVLMDIVLIAGAVIVYRNMRKEMDLVRLKSDFVSNVSHELRTPLSLIRMYAETLEMGRLTNEEKKQEYYGTILQETERLTRLVNNILSFSRMEAGRKEYHFEQTDVNDVVSGVLDTYQLRLETEGFTPVMELDPGLGQLRADKEAMSEAIINILDNAIKYSGKEKYLRISTGKTDRGIFIEFEDRGIGISPSQHEKIFETFYRVSSGPVHNTKGSGLGLSLVRHIMDAHGGTVSLKSYPGDGSIFRLEIPHTSKS